MHQLGRRLLGNLQGYYDYLTSNYSVSCFWPLDDADTWTATANSIDEDAGGSHTSFNRLDSPSTWYESTKLVKGLDSAATTPLTGCTYGYLYPALVHGNEGATYQSATWIGWIKATEIPTSGFTYLIGGVGGNDPIVGYDKRPGPGWVMLHGGLTVDLSSVGGLSDNDSLNTCMYVMSIERIGVNNFTKRSWLCTSGTVYAAGSLTSSGAWDAGQVQIQCGHGKTIYSNAFSLLTEAITTDAQVTALYNVGRV